MKTQNTIKMLAVVSASLLAAQAALAQGVGNIGSLPTQFVTTNPPNGWVVADPAGGPIPVELNPSGPQWSKAFTGPNGGPFAQPAFGPPLPVTEVLVVSGNLPWTDWHEDVIGVDASGLPDPGWVWANPFILVNGAPPAGLSIVGAGTGSLSFFFNPVAPGSLVQIRKELVYNGLPGTTFIGTLAIHEYPTPEPATIGLLAVGGLAMLRRRTSHRGRTAAERNAP
ncbi:MAG: PEP-CTERM sorting domain-containing protein [Phycisphaerae bacterium]